MGSTPRRRRRRRRPQPCGLNLDVTAVGLGPRTTAGAPQRTAALLRTAGWARAWRARRQRVGSEEEAGRRRAAVVEARRRRKAEANRRAAGVHLRLPPRESLPWLALPSNTQPLGTLPLSARSSSLPSLLSSGAPRPKRALPWPPWPLSSMGAARSRTPPGPPSLGGQAPAARARWGRSAVLAGAGPCPGAAGGGRMCAGALGGRAITYDAPLLCCCSSVGGGS